MTAESWRYANCPCKGKEHHPGWVSSDVSDGFLPDCQETVLVPDSRLQAIADAWNEAGPNPGYHQKAQHRLAHQWPTLYLAIKNALTEENSGE